MKLVLAILLLGSLTGLKAQRGTGVPVNRVMARIPDSLTTSTNGIAYYINMNFSTQKEKSRAIFLWIAKNIEYSFDSMFDNSIYEAPASVSERILKTRTGVCLQYADLFSELAGKTGIRCYVIQGYTQQEEHIDVIPHVWCGAVINSSWCFFDPTWGSGYVSNGRFIKQVNNFYFMTKPEVFIRSHMPFDPLWQFLHYPITNQEFYDRHFQSDASRTFFNFQDTLSVYEHETPVEQYISSARRIEQNGVKNSFIEAKLRVLYGKITYHRNQAAAETYNTAVDLYNEGIKKINRFISERNNQFESETDPANLIRMLDSTEVLFNHAVGMLLEIKDADESIVSALDLLNKAIGESIAALKEQQFFLHGYLKTWVHD
jgi:hypothetical protein